MGAPRLAILVSLNCECERNDDCRQIRGWRLPALENVTIKEGAIVEVRVPPEGEPARKRPSIQDLPFYGTWAERDDITDGMSYVNKLRDNPRA